MNGSLRTLHKSVLSLFLLLMLASLTGELASAKPVVKAKGGSPTPQTFFRQRNTLSNIDFFVTNKGVLFNNDNVAGLHWPRGSTTTYVFGGGVWFATQKIINGKRRKLCELGYNPNSGSGWYIDGEADTSGNGLVDHTNSKYITYVGPRYNATSGEYDHVNRNSVSGAEYWPIWDTSITKTLNKNYYFGDYISDLTLRASLAGKTLPNGKIPKPAILSQEDFVNIYTDQDATNNPEYRPNTGYPFGLNIVESIHSWSFGAYRDMIFVRHKVTNVSTDTLFDCFLAPAFDPDIGLTGTDAANDKNQYVGSDTSDFGRAKRLLKGTCFEDDPTRLNMAYQWSNNTTGGQDGAIGFAFLESPVVDPLNKNIVLDITDSAAVGGYGLPASRKQLGLATFKKWTISNDPPSENLRYDFCADGVKDGDNGITADVRLLFSTGPFTLPPKRSAETCVAIAIAKASTTSVKLNIDSLFKLIAFAHSVFGDDCYIKYDSTYNDVDSIWVKNSQVVHFQAPQPPNIPVVKTQSLDRAIYLTWNSDSTSADSSKDRLSPKTLAFNKYELWRTTRSDHDSTIRPDGINPNVKLGEWYLYDLKADTVYTTKGYSVHYTRKNTTPNIVPHSYLDIGDDNHDGALSSNEILLNGARYYYYVLASDEYDSVNNVGPLQTSIVQDKNFVMAIPAKPVFPDLPTELSPGVTCFSGNNQTVTPKVGGMKDIAVQVVDTGKFVEWYSNDTVMVSFQPRWTEYTQKYLNQSILNINMDVTDTRHGLNLTYDNLYHPNAASPINPYQFDAGIRQQILGQNADSNVAGKFTTDNGSFAPYQRIDQAFLVLADYQFTQLKDPYRLSKIDFFSGNQGESGILRLSHRTLPDKPGAPPLDMSNLQTRTNPSFLGGMGEVTYKIIFGEAEDMHEVMYDTTLKKDTVITSIKDQSSGAEFHPRPLKVYVTSKTHCDEPLRLARDGNRNDYQPEADYRFYTTNVQNNPPAPGIYFPAYSDPDTMLVPHPGLFSIDAFHYSDDDPVNHSAALPVQKTSGDHYFHENTPSGSKYLFTVHRIRLAGAEIMLNYPDILDASTTGDTSAQGNQFQRDFQKGDTIFVTFSGQSRGLPFPGAKFEIHTSPEKPVDFKDPNLYSQQEILDQIQVVPNPFIVEHIGQSSTDNAKLFFTRLPPRATIQIYTLDGNLVKTLEHRGYVSETQNSQTTYDYSDLSTNRYNVEEWNLLSEGKQRVGSQVLIARIIAKDPNNGDVAIGETTVKFAVIIGGYRQVVH